jgi:hypothetical protein
MYWLIENQEQLDKFKKLNIDNVFVELILENDNIHPNLNKLVAIYIKPFNDKGYILSLDHNDTCSLKLDEIINIVNSFSKIYVLDKKRFLYFFNNKNAIDLYFYVSFDIKNISIYDFYYNKYKNIKYINKIIPITKHYQYCENLFNNIKNISFNNNPFFDKMTYVFFYVENNGIKINKKIFDSQFEINNDMYNIKNDIIYTYYNLYNKTGRPSNSFNNINFMALNKKDNSRESFIPKNDIFIEIDISAYHPTLIGQMLNFNFENKNPYEYLSEKANISLNKAKELMFQNIYGGIKSQYKHIEFFKILQNFIDNNWKNYNNYGEVIVPISSYCFKKDELENMNPYKLFNYMLQQIETANNVNILYDIIKILKNLNSQIILYVYDSILIDLDKSEKHVLDYISNIFDKYNLKIKLKKGKTYNLINE